MFCLRAAKREVGAKPTRTRRCERVVSQEIHWMIARLGRDAKCRCASQKTCIEPSVHAHEEQQGVYRISVSIDVVQKKRTAASIAAVFFVGLEARRKAEEKR